MIDPLPEPLERALRAGDGNNGDVVIAIAGDVTPNGAFGEEFR